MASIMLSSVLVILVIQYVNSASVTVQTTLGPVTGTTSTFSIPGLRGYSSFYAIPYGADTSGANRFKLPQAAAPWSLPKDVSSSDRLKNLACVQKDGSGIRGTEDCLAVSVYTRKLPSGGVNPKLPVMVFIHGGSFLSGDGQLFTGLKFMQKDIVLVAIQYRLGVFGFMTTHTQSAPGNAGLYDQNLGLHWVKDNIANFGGDPDSITLFGESAGATAVGHHIISPMSAGLFHRAILQSGSALSPWAIEEKPMTFHSTFGEKVGCQWDENNPEAYVNCLENVAASTLVSATFEVIADERLKGHHGFLGYSPVIQEVSGITKFISEDPVYPLAQGNFNRVPVIIGSNKHEGSFPLGIFYNEYLVPANLVDSSDFLNYEVMKLFIQTLEITDETSVVESAMESTYLRNSPRDTFNGVMPGMIDFVGTTLLKAGGWSTALFMSNREVPVYTYTVDYQGANSFYALLFGDNVPPIPHGCSHGDELAYLFAYPPTLNAADSAFSKALIKTWVNFATYGDPTPGTESPKWPAMTRKSPSYMVLDKTRRVESGFSKTYTVTWDEWQQGIYPSGYTAKDAKSTATKLVTLKDIEQYEADLANPVSYLNNRDVAMRMFARDSAVNPKGVGVPRTYETEDANRTN